MARTGRPPKKTKDKLNTAVRMAEFGFTDAQIAYCIDVDRTTVCNWKKENPDFFNSLKTAKAQADDKVEKSLFKRALGFSYTEVQKTVNAAGIITKETTIRKRVAPDTIACIFWLKNRRPEQWREKPEAQEGEDDNELKIIIDDDGTENEPENQ